MNNQNIEHAAMWVAILAVIFMTAFTICLIALSAMTALIVTGVFMIPVTIMVLKEALLTSVPQGYMVPAKVIIGARVSSDGYREPFIYFSGFNIRSPLHVLLWDLKASLESIDLSGSTQLECSDGVAVEAKYTGKIVPDSNNPIPYLRLSDDDKVRRLEAKNTFQNTLTGVMNTVAHTISHTDLLGAGKVSLEKGVMDTFDNSKYPPIEEIQQEVSNPLPEGVYEHRRCFAGVLVEYENGFQVKLAQVGDISLDQETLNSAKQLNIARQDMKAIQELIELSRENGKEFTPKEALDQLNLMRGKIKKSPIECLLPEGKEDLAALFAMFNQNKGV